jgi:ABC-type branched-subunit amino acid transport system substrate-binding protein
MLLGLSVIELDTTNSSYIRSELPKVAESYAGLTGPIGFDENGDRNIFRMGLFAYGFKENREWDLIRYHDHS